MTTKVKRVTLTATAWLVLALAGSAVPKPARAQPVLFCGDCIDMMAIHTFSSAFVPWGTNQCDNVGGCHLWQWYTLSCLEAHDYCFLDMDALKAGLASKNTSMVVATLALSSNWTYEPFQRQLTLLNCKQLVVARYTVPASMDITSVVRPTKWADLLRFGNPSSAAPTLRT